MAHPTQDQHVDEGDLESFHPEYTYHLPDWEKCRNVVKGARAVKDNASEYLPYLSDQRTSDYEAYKKRAVFYHAAQRTLDGLLGAVFRNEPVLQCDAYEDPVEFYDSLSVEHLSFRSFLRTVLREVLITGRYGILVDMASEPTEGGRQQPYFSGYTAENIVDWQQDRGPGGSIILRQIVLREDSVDRTTQQIFPYRVETDDEKVRYRVLTLENQDNPGVYVQEIWERDSATGKPEAIGTLLPTKKGRGYIKVDEIVPTLGGRPMDFIPFFLCKQAGGSEYTAMAAPLLGLCELNLSHYRTYADLEHGRHFCALPTIFATGFPADTKLNLGSGVAWISEQPNASAQYLEFTGAGLGSLERALEQKEQQMAVLGARLLESQTRDKEASETHRLRRSGEDSILATAANTLSIEVTKAVQIAAVWTGMMDSHVDSTKVQLNTDFATYAADPNLIRELRELVAGNLLSIDSFLSNLKKFGVLPESVSEEDEKDRLEEDQKDIMDALTTSDNVLPQQPPVQEQEQEPPPETS